MSQEEKNAARMDVRDRIRKLDSKYMKRVKNVLGRVYCCGDKDLLKEIKEAYASLLTLYPEYSFDFTRHIPYISENSYEIMRLKRKKAFNKTKISFDKPFIIDKIDKGLSYEDILAYRKQYGLFFIDNNDKLLYEEDLGSLQFYFDIQDDETSLGLIASNAEFLVRYHSGYHNIVYTRDPGTNKPIQFREYCIVSDVKSCSYIADTPRKERIDTCIQLNSPTYLYKANREELSQIEIYKSKIMESTNEIEIIF